jgi:hypothetical protein
VIGIAIAAGSLLLPWYGVAVAGGLVKTGIGTFGFATVAFLLTLGAALVLILRSARGHRLPRPLRVGTLLAAAGIWLALLVVLRMADRPDFEIIGIQAVGLRYGIFVALAGAIIVIVGGVRRRGEELAAERKRSPRDRNL